MSHFNSWPRGYNWQELTFTTFLSRTAHLSPGKSWKRPNLQVKMSRHSNTCSNFQFIQYFGLLLNFYKTKLLCRVGCLNSFQRRFFFCTKNLADGWPKRNSVTFFSSVFHVSRWPFKKTRKTNIEFNWNFLKKKSFFSNLVMIWKWDLIKSPKLMRQSEFQM